MIGALLSNTPASLLRHSGVAGDLALGADNSVQAREPLTARDSQASPRAEAISGQKSPILTSQAILALQDPEGAGRTARRQQQADQTGRGQTDGADTNSGQANGASGQAAADAPADDPSQPPATDASAQQAGEENDSDGDGLNEAEEKVVEKLKQRDREVRAHEQAHARVGGAYAGAPSYTFQQGPDGKRYAVGGEVQIDTAPERTPEATIRKMRIVISAALAPAEPSGQDLSVAQQARSQLSEAQAELRQQKLEELKGDDDDAGTLDGVSESSGAETSASENPAGPSSSGGNEDGPGQGGRETDSRDGTAVDRSAVNAYQAVIDRVAEQQSSAQSLVI